jgi:hypothetical protein
VIIYVNCTDRLVIVMYINFVSCECNVYVMYLTVSLQMVHDGPEFRFLQILARLLYFCNAIHHTCCHIVYLPALSVAVLSLCLLAS